MQTHALSDLAWERMVTAVQKVRDRLQRAVRALEEGKIPYAVVGDNAVAAWVCTVDEAAVRNTQNIDLLVRLADLGRMKVAFTQAGFVQRPETGINVFFDDAKAKARDAVRIVYANEKVSEDSLSSLNVDCVQILGEFRVLNLESLVNVMLASFKLGDRVNARDLIDVGLVDASWCARLPDELAKRLQALLDTPDG